MTPFARLFLLLLVLVPAAFIVASYVNGEDPIANIKQMVGLEEKDATPRQNEQTYTPGGNDEIEDLRRENAQLRRRVQELEAQLRQVEETGGKRESWGG